MIYIDPPFNTGQDFSFTAKIPQHTFASTAEEFVKAPSLIEQKAYRDTWKNGLESYLGWLSETAVLLRELLAENGTIFIHLDVHVGPYAKVVLDEVFGIDNFMNQIAWYYYNKLHGQTKRCLPKAFDIIFCYVKNRSVDYTYHTLTEARDKPIKKLKYRFIKGKIENLKDEAGKTITYESTERQIDNVWRIRCLQPANLEEWVDFDTQKPVDLLERLLEVSSNPGNLVLDCFVGSGSCAIAAERQQRRWIACDLGRFAIHTTRKRLLGINGVKPFVVQNLGKYERQQWQVAEFATSTLSSRAQSRDPMPAGGEQKRGGEFSEREHGENALQGRLSQQAGKGSPFDSLPAVGRSGQAFDSATTSHSRSSYSAQDDRVRGGAQDDRLREPRERETAYRKFILELYHATPVSGHVWLHGVKGGRMVHVAAVDAPVTRADVNAIAAEVWKAAGKGPNSPQKPAVDILGWEFALELNETAKEVAAQARVDAAFKKIPREVLEKKAVEQGDVHFFELGALSVETKIKKRELTLKLSDFVIPLDDVPAEVRSAIKHWSQMVDYWAVDWDFKDDTFHNQWQSYRTRKNPKLELSIAHEYVEPGKYMVVVKVIDILGNDTTKTMEVEVK